MSGRGAEPVGHSQAEGVRAPFALPVEVRYDEDAAEWHLFDGDGDLLWLNDDDQQGYNEACMRFIARALNATTNSPAPEAPTGEPVAWRPIETAPKDRTPILVWWDDEEMPDVVFWSTESRRWIDDYGAPYMDPTHWMPLPTPPKEPE